MTTELTPQGLPVDLPRYIRRSLSLDGGWFGADHQNGPWRPIPVPFRAEITVMSDRGESRLIENPPGQPVATQPPFPVAEEPPTTVCYEFEVRDEHDQTVASGKAPTMEDAQREGRHYLAQYQQDGPCTMKVRRVEVLEVSDLEPAPAAMPPLWLAMNNAYNSAPDYHAGCAAEILTVRDWLFPGGRPDPVRQPDCLAVWFALSTEATRAERGQR